MLHGINNTFLYSAKKIVAVWVHETDAVELRGTGFFIDKDSELILVTNRHVVEPGYYGDELNRMLSYLQDYPVEVIVLCPNVEVIKERELHRGKTGYTGFTVEALYNTFMQTPPKTRAAGFRCGACRSALFLPLRDMLARGLTEIAFRCRLK